jgi:hypothetical protein
LGFLAYFLFLLEGKKTELVKVRLEQQARARLSGWELE